MHLKITGVDVAVYDDDVETSFRKVATLFIFNGEDGMMDATKRCLDSSARDGYQPS